MAQIRAVNLPGWLSLRHPPPHPLTTLPTKTQNTAQKPQPRLGMVSRKATSCRAKKKVRIWWPLAKPTAGAGPRPRPRLAQCTVSRVPTCLYLYVHLVSTNSSHNMPLHTNCTPQHTMAQVMHETHYYVSISFDEKQVAHHHFHLMSQHYP